MNLATYAGRNLFRRKGRTIMTIVAVAIGVLIYSGIRTAVASWNLAAEQATKDRLGTRHKTSFTFQLPKRYIDEVRALPGVESATWGLWFAGKDPKERVPFFQSLAVDHNTWFEVMDEMIVDPAALAEWKQTPSGAIIGEVIAKQLDVKVGGKLVIKSDIYPGDWEFKVVGLYKPARATIDRSSVIFRWDYFNNDPRNETSKDQIGWVLSRVKNMGESAKVTREIDGLFDQKDDKTITMSERAMNLSFLGMFAGILNAFDLISLMILFILTLILANTISMSVRERTHEYGVLRAIGFSPKYIVAFIVIEAMLVAFAGGLLGAALTLLLINGALGPALEQAPGMSVMFPYFRTPISVVMTAVVAAAVIGAFAGALPSIRAARLKVTDALRRLD